MNPRKTPNSPLAIDKAADPMFSWSPRPSARTLSLPEQIAEQIGNAIIRGKYEPGQRVQEQEVANAFQVSRGPVREALRILERDGLVQINARRGAQVTKLDVSEVNDLFEVRASLMALSARLATQRRDPHFLAEIRTAAERLKNLARAPNPDEYVNEIYKLNMLMAEASGNPYLRNMVFSLAHQTLRYARLGLSTEQRRQQSATNWRRLAAAVHSSDADAAFDATAQLVRDSRAMAVKLLIEEPVNKPPARAARKVSAGAPAKSARTSPRRRAPVPR